MHTTGYPPRNAAMRAHGFAVILHESDYLDLISRHSTLNQGDYLTYLGALHHQMSAAQRANRHVLVGPFLTDQYESYAEATGEPASSPRALHAYNDFVTRASLHTRTWTGEPITHVVAALRHVTDTQPNQANSLPLNLPYQARQPTPPTIRPWRLTSRHATPLTPAQALDLSCTNPTTGQPIPPPPEPATRYASAIPLTAQPP